MKVLMLAPYPLDPSKAVRGVEAVTVNLVDGLRQTEMIDLEVGSVIASVQHRQTRVIDGVTIHYRPASRMLGNLTLGMEDRHTAKDIINKVRPDIVHVQYHFAYPYLFQKPHVPTIATVHGLSFKEAAYENEPLDPIRRLPRLALERLALRNIDQMTCVSQYVRDQVRPLTDATVHVIENPVADHYFRARETGRPNRVLFVGSIIRRKNILDLLKAVNVLRRDLSITLHVVGVIEEQYYYNLLTDYIEQNHLGAQVIWRGVLSEGELVREYEECAVLVLPSLEESAGMVIQQAMAAGKPVVASRVGGIPSIVEDGVTGILTPPGDVTELAGALSQTLNDAALRVRFGQAGRMAAITRFSRDSVTQATMALYRAVLATRGSRR